jgi:hypothetical protein
LQRTDAHVRFGKHFPPVAVSTQWKPVLQRISAQEIGFAFF